MSQGVQFNRLMLEMRAMQTDAMARAKPEVKTQEVGAPSFSDMLGQAVNKVHETQQIASQKASVSFQAMTQVRNKLVQAYQDIMQMPV